MEIFDFLKICKHSYICIGRIDVSEEVNSIYYYVCKRCGKRRVSMDKMTEIGTAEWFKERLKMWEKHEYELIDADFSIQYLSNEAVFLESCLDK